MKKITAFECEYCCRILKTKHGMRAHESKCFVNPESKSCITCKHLGFRNCIDGVPLTEKEELIFEFKVEGTYTVRSGGDEECDYNEWIDKYKYLEFCEPYNYCNYFRDVLPKLRTNCSRHATK